MKILLSLLTLLIVPFGQAVGCSSFQLHGVTLADLARVVVIECANKSLVLDAEAMTDKELLSFNLKATTEAATIRQFRELVRSRRFSLDLVDGVYHLRRTPEIEDDILVYLPKYRAVSYLTDLLGSVVPHGSLTTQRMISPQDQGLAPQQPVNASSRETSTNALGMIDKSDKDALVIKAKPEQIRLAKKVLGEVDRPVPEMLVKAVVLEVQTGRTEGSAVNLVASLLKSGIGLGASIGGSASDRNAVTFKVGTAGLSIDALWSAISSDKRFKVVSAPQIRVKSGSSARFAVGSDTPVLGAVNYQGNGQSVQSIEYKPSGVILDLRPEIRGELAELKVFQQLSSFARTETGVNNSPTLLKRELNTSVVVAQNDVVLIGGLDEEKITADDAGLFFLPSWLRSHSEDKTRSEIVLMLHVERVRTPGESI